jgi:hypothetical protein
MREQQIEEARRMARVFWHWALWLESESNKAFNAISLEELENLRLGGWETYEEWRRISAAQKPDWLKEG